MSARTDIRTNAAAILVSASIAGPRVIQGRANTLDGAVFPVIYLYAVKEDIETQTLRPTQRTQYRKLALIVDYFDVQTSTTVIDNQFDTASLSIETALLADPTISAAAGDCLLTNVEYMIEPDEDRRWGCARHTFEIIYLTRT